MLLGDLNAYHQTWSLDGKLGPGGRVLAEWVQEVGGEIHFGEGVTFEKRRGGGVVQCSFDFAVTSPDFGWTGEAASWLLSDHAAFGGLW